MQCSAREEPFVWVAREVDAQRSFWNFTQS